MKRLKKGPELKMPELKVPPFLSDLFYDLRDRRLLPLVALVVVAIVAVPFLLGGESEDRHDVAGLAVRLDGRIGRRRLGTKLTVVEADARTARLPASASGTGQPTNPFKQRYAGPVLKGVGTAAQSTTRRRAAPRATSVTLDLDDDERSRIVAARETVQPNSPTAGGAAHPHPILFNFARDRREDLADGNDGRRRDEACPNRAPGRGPGARPAAGPEGAGRHLHGHRAEDRAAAVPRLHRSHHDVRRREMPLRHATPASCSKSNRASR